MGDTEKCDLDNYISDCRSRIRAKTDLRQKNLDANNERPDESFFRKLDSNLKKNTAFVKKLKALTESQRPQLVRDFGALNLSKYVGEMATSLVEAKLKMNDIPTAVELSSLAHQRYADFSPAMLDQWKKLFPRKKDEKIANASKLRVDLRFYAELVVVGVFPEKEGLQLLGAVLTFLIETDKTTHQNLPIITAFCKFCGEDYAGLMPRNIRLLADKLGITVPKATIFSAERRNKVHSLLIDYYDSLSKHVMEDYKQMKALQKRNARQYEMKGEVHVEASQQLEEVKAAFEKLKQSACVLSDIVDKEQPSLPEETNDELLTLASDGMIIEMDTTFRGGVDGDGSLLWEDEDTRQFYETLPELRAMLPGILFKDSEKATLEPVVEKIEEEEIEEENEGISDESKEPTPESDGQTEETLEDKTTEFVEEVAALEEEEIEESENVSGSTLKILVEAFIDKLPTLVNRDMIDKAAVDFVTNLNSKPNRRKLGRALYLVKRTRLDLLPFYGRFVAILEPVMPDLGTELVQNLIKEFKMHLRRKNQLHMESKIKVCRFVGELTKFRICPKSEALFCYKQLLFDFRHHNIDMACALLDSCGYFLFHSIDSHQKTKILLEQMMRKRNAAVGLDQRYQLMIDNAFYSCNPPAAGAIQKIELPPLQQYIENLLYKELGKTSVEKVLKQMRKIDWSENKMASFTAKRLSFPWKLKYNCIQWLASVLAGIMYYHDWIGVRVVDTVLEDIRIGMEVNHPRLNQRRLAVLKYLGEMYNYRVVDSGIIFSVLYSLITMGVSFDAKLPSPFDPPEHLLRIRLVVVLLETCGEYFSQGSSKRKLDCFLVYFLRYYWNKRSADIWSSDRPFPLETENAVKDIAERLRPKLKLFESLEEAEKGVKSIEEEYKEKIEEALKFLPTDDQGIEEDDGDEEGLRPIDERDEFEYISSQEPGGSQSQDVEQSSAMYDDDEDEHLNIHTKQSAKCAEDDDFLAAFDKMMMDSVQQRTHESVPQPDFVVPANAKQKLDRKTKFAVEDDEEENRASPEAQDEQAQKNMSFVLMTKGKGSKPALKSVKVEYDSDLAEMWRERELAEQREKEKLKKITLDMARGIEQEEIAEAEQSMRNVFVFPNRPAQEERRGGGPKQFKHQKGAPLANQIFSSWQ